MAYTDFSFDRIEEELGVRVHSADLFPGLAGAVPPGWLADTLQRGLGFSLLTEKARSEFIVAPILLALRELTGNRLSILSGPRLDVDADRRLTGECDFLLSFAENVPRVRGPLFAVVEAKRNDIEGGLGQCIAQMVGARLFNERNGHPTPEVAGCVTTGESWQFLRLTGDEASLHTRRFFINGVEMILAAFLNLLSRAAPV
ncbi:hypothetical protein [Zavarzinella formosa]|uniref:hypothetical protein n=1 Tax=Zavarzinella formosa TaxID=360055 RepID=UPI0002EB27B0|nr:hypothetical protein [Zavarzinella formosa]